MNPIAVSAGTALVGAMATDAWQQARAATMAVWRRTGPDRADHIGAQLEALRAQVLLAREHRDPDTEQALAGAWRLYLQQLVQADPAFADDLRRLLAEHLHPALAAHERARQSVMASEAPVHHDAFAADRHQYRTGR